MNQGMLLRALLNVTDDEARTIWEALGQFVENEDCDHGREDNKKPLLAPARDVLDRMNSELAALAGPVTEPVESTAVRDTYPCRACGETFFSKRGRAGHEKNSYCKSRIKSDPRRVEVRR